jgi:hypothetical protein
VFTARWLQNRALRVRQRGVILSLLAEVKNIRGELGVDIDGRAAGNANDLIRWDGAHHRVTEMSDWVSSLLPEIAALQPEVVEQFLSLRRHLANTASSVEIDVREKSGRTATQEHKPAAFERATPEGTSEPESAAEPLPWALFAAHGNAIAALNAIEFHLREENQRLTRSWHDRMPAWLH